MIIKVKEYTEDFPEGRYIYIEIEDEEEEVTANVLLE
jgi:hypothetical protein